MLTEEERNNNPDYQRLSRNFELVTTLMQEDLSEIVTNSMYSAALIAAAILTAINGRE